MKKVSYKRKDSLVKYLPNGLRRHSKIKFHIEVLFQLLNFLIFDFYLNINNMTLPGVLLY